VYFGKGTASFFSSAVKGIGHTKGPTTVERSRGPKRGSDSSSKEVCEHEKMKRIRAYEPLAV